jgi:hypothetical protein
VVPFSLVWHPHSAPQPFPLSPAEFSSVQPPVLTPPKPSVHSRSREVRLNTCKREQPQPNNQRIACGVVFEIGEIALTIPNTSPRRLPSTTSSSRATNFRFIHSNNPLNLVRPIHTWHGVWRYQIDSHDGVGAESARPHGRGYAATAAYESQAGDDSERLASKSHTSHNSSTQHCRLYVCDDFCSCYVSNATLIHFPLSRTISTCMLPVSYAPK